MVSGKILIVEDDSTLRRVLKDNFEGRGFRVELARDGEEGLEMALNARPDLIVLDVMLPRRNGYEVCAAVRQRDPEMPILMLTAKGREEDVVRGLELGADDYMPKPFGVRELLARAEALLRRSRARVSDRYRWGDCELDLVSHKLFRNGAEVALTPKEFGLLELFVRRAGRALTRNDIMDRVWGDSVVVTARSVDRCVTTLRAKIEPDPRRPTYIQTVRDVGYRFEAPDGCTGA